MQLQELLSPARIVVYHGEGSKKRLLQVLSVLLSRTDEDQIDDDELFQAYIARERLGSTGIGHGIAIPHIRSSAVTAPLGALIVCEESIDYDSPDKQPVDLIFGMLVPEEAPEKHLQLLSEIASDFSNADFRDTLRKAKDNQTLRLAVPHYYDAR